MMHRGSNWAYFGGYYFAKKALGERNLFFFLQKNDLIFFKTE